MGENRLLAWLDFANGVTIAGRRIDPILAAFLFVLIVSAVFLVVPQLDIWVSSLFYDAKIGFPASFIPILVALRQLNDIVLVAVIVVLVVSLIAKLVLPDRQSFVAPAASLFLLSSLVLGPGLVVNAILKNFSGRPRPIDVEQFGGNLPFVQVWHFTRECARNCSFVSGEASSAIWVVAVVLVLPLAYRARALRWALVYTVAISVNRIAFGGHFLSDVLLAWGITLLVIAVCYRLVYLQAPAWLQNERLESQLGRAGSGARKAVTSVLTGERRG